MYIVANGIFGVMLNLFNVVGGDTGGGSIGGGSNYDTTTTPRHNPEKLIYLPSCSCAINSEEASSTYELAVFEQNL